MAVMVADSAVDAEEKDRFVRWLLYDFPVSRSQNPRASLQV